MHGRIVPIGEWTVAEKIKCSGTQLADRHPGAITGKQYSGKRGTSLYIFKLPFQVCRLQ